MPEHSLPTLLAPNHADAFARTAIADVALGETVAQATGATLAPPSTSMTSSVAKSTVLPRVGGAGLVHEVRSRYQMVKVLGAGGMGEVTLAQDQDIGRPVALKHLHASATDAANVARFVEEIRTVGSLEHPNIVPIHDVGLGDDGRYFFVMKHIEGETLEDIITKLAAGDPAYRDRYSFEYRTEIFSGILRALQFAHSRGFVHRDIKPANVMVGRFGEVMLMDWGIAKAKAGERDEAPALPALSPEPGAPAEGRARLFSTRHGSLIGTPAYMSPEQARGQIDSIDERSDIYSASVLFHELISAQHYLADKATMPAMLAGVVSEEFGFLKLLGMHHPDHPVPPGELLHFVEKGLRKDPAARYQSVDEMIDGLLRISEGRIKIQCHVTATKRLTREMSRMVDRAPNVSFLLMLSGVLLFACSILVAARSLLATSGH